MATYRRQVGAVTVTLKGSYSGIGQMLRDHMMITGTYAYAEDIKTRAEAAAPVDTGAYKTSFSLHSAIGPTSVGNQPRAYTQVVNSVHHALYIEWGNDRIRKHATLRKAAGVKDFSADKGTPRGK